MKFSDTTAVYINFFQPSIDATSNHFYLLQNVRGIPAFLLVEHYPARWYITPT